MQIGGGASGEALPGVLVWELLDQPSVLFSPRPTFFFFFFNTSVILTARVCLLSTAVLTAGNGLTYGYIP